MNTKNKKLSFSNPVIRFSFLDVLRGIAAIAVIFSHVLENSFPHSVDFTDNFINFGQVGVVSFFLISGFIIPYTLERSKNFTDYFIRRFFRIYPLYFFAFLLGLYLLYTENWVANDNNSTISTSFILSHLTFTQEYIKNVNNVVPGSWTLFLEIIWYGLAAVIFLFFKDKTLPIFSAMIFQIALTIISIAIDVRFPLGRTGLLICCAIGYATYLNSAGRLSSIKLKKILWMAFFTISFSTYVNFGLFHDGTRFSWNCVLLSWATAFSLFFLFWKKQNTFSIFHKIFSWLGEISYSLYLVHGFVIFFCKYNNFEGRLLFIIAPICSIIIGWITWRLIEIPGIDIGRNISKMLNVKAPKIL